MSERRLSEIAQRLVQPEGVTSSDFKLINSGGQGRDSLRPLAERFSLPSVRKTLRRQVRMRIRRSGPVQLQTDRQDVHRRNFDIHPVRRTRRDSGHLDRAPYAHLR